MANQEVKAVFAVEPGRLASAGSERQLDQELARQLRARLILICCLLMPPLLIILALVSAFPEQAANFHHTDRNLGVLTLLSCLLPLLYLVRSPRISLARLRLLEIWLFGSAVLSLALGQYRWFVSGWLPQLANVHVEGRLLELASDSITLPWFFLIVFYGTCIPNTGRRCAVAVLGMATIGYGVLLLLSFQGGDLGPILLQHAWLKTLFWLAVSVAIAVFGSKRIHNLSRAAVHARKLGQYEIKRKLGAGGMGEVYLAEQPLLRRPCALKIVRPEKAGDPCNLARFLREVQAMASLNGPNAVDVFDYGQSEDGTFYYVMEYLSGLNLQEIVDRYGPMSPERTVHVLLQVCKALEEAHQIGLIHRDVKPSNIFLCRRGVQCDLVKLVDFGLVYEAHCEDPGQHNITQTGVVLGSPLYMSPEQLRGNEQLDARCDLYGLGLVAYVLLTGKHPFMRANVQAIFAAHLTESPVPLAELRPEMPADLAVIVMRCLEKEPPMRYEGAASLAAALTRTGCAARWTQERAEAWWRTHAPHTLLNAPAAS